MSDLPGGTGTAADRDSEHRMLDGVLSAGDRGQSEMELTVAAAIYAGRLASQLRRLMPGLQPG